MKTPLVAPELRELIQRHDISTLQDFCKFMHPMAVADYLSTLPPHDIWEVLRVLEPNLRAEIFSNLDEDVQLEVAESLTRDELAQLISDMPPDDRVDLFKKIPPEKQDLILPALAKAEREDIRKLASYPEGTAGSVMTSDYVALPPDITVREAIERIRLEAPDRETVYYAYVVDEKRRLIGLVSLKDLILAPPHKLVKDIMYRDVIYARVTDDQEDVARMIQRYDLIALPIVNGDNVLVGIITHDDAADIITQEHTEDLEKFTAIGGPHEAGVYMKTPVWHYFRYRAPWVIGLAGLELISGFIIHSFEETLSSLIILAMYLPMMAATGGNTGSQTAALVIRALALGEVSARNFFKVIFKELQVGLLIGLLLGLLLWLKVSLFAQYGQIPAGLSASKVGFAIALAFSLQVLLATFLGASLPLAASALKLDPAFVAGPTLATLMDILGMLIYFSSAKIILNL
ncbi:magnesium transporter [Thermodesulforhabdus norvegica]|uniref:Magnesium transporter MgtE n=1 Tax=Thermodesulforhabdus norvegica TaxID=39841 RepID=A0A1I4SC60_9BACT|nr:magnesium transporter [Thermodesulforhabdus norvegica]SFM61921.1 magnesium transporter [Thermodesulforhabdus norvegica]